MVGIAWTLRRATARWAALAWASTVLGLPFGTDSLPPVAVIVAGLAVETGFLGNLI